MQASCKSVHEPRMRRIVFSIVLGSGRKPFGFQIDGIETEFPCADCTSEFFTRQDLEET
jgi:hypothetical protein